MFNLNNYDEINRMDVRSLESMIESFVRGIMDSIPYTFDELLDAVCYQLALHATKAVIEATKDAYDRYKKKN